MSWVAVAIAGAAVVGAVVSSNESSNANDAQQTAAQNADNLQAQEFNVTQQNQMPWRQAGMSALQQMQGGQFTHNFDQNDFHQDPGYQFNLQQGQQALQRSAAASGGLMSGGTMKAMGQYTQGMASNEYSNAYNRFTQNQTNQFNRLASVAGLGQTANAQVDAAGMNSANQMGQNMMGAANAQGAADIARGNQISGLATGGANAFLGYQQMQNQQNMMNTYFNNSPNGQASNAWLYGQNGQINNTPALSQPEMGSQYGGQPSGYSLGTYNLGSGG